MLYKQIEQNKRKTILLMLLFSVTVLVIGWAVGYLFNGDYFSGPIIALIILAIYLPITYMSANAQVLKMSGAKEIQKEDNPMLFNIVEELSLAARIPMPKIYIVNDPAPNAFATGTKPENGVVAFTTGLLERLNREELEGVAAHEIAHIRNYDIRLMTVCIALVAVVALIAEIGMRMFYVRGGRNRNQRTHPALLILAIVFVILAPLAARFVHFAVSRNREYLADATAVELTRNKVGLKNALIKISHSDLDVKKATEASAAMYISNPFRNKTKKKTNWFATHPPIESRVERLENM
ncbi:zinc metalloprotease HtpX [Pueribacillus sp. YX66]|uniref:zinc metalloprotease HtpX n=1 Tax=Pueribacillus sp. YX66 TaxID=3229242 RepID=UPI00358D3E64